MAFDIRTPNPSPQKKEEIKRATNQNVKPSFGTTDGFKYSPEYHKMADFLGVNKEDKMDINLAEKIAFIRDYTGQKDELDAMVKVRDMIKELGIQSQGKELLISLYKYVRLAQDKAKIDKEMNLITDNGRK